jgi:hypothetical protein
MCRDVSNTVHVFQGDLDKQRDGPVFLTLHDVGHSYLAWVNFVNTPEMEAVRRRWDPLKEQSHETENALEIFPLYKVENRII